MKNPVGIQARNTKNQQDTVLRFALGAGGRWFKSIRPDSGNQSLRRVQKTRLFLCPHECPHGRGSVTAHVEEQRSFVRMNTGTPDVFRTAFRANWHHEASPLDDLIGWTEPHEPLSSSRLCRL